MRCNFKIKLNNNKINLSHKKRLKEENSERSEDL